MLAASPALRWEMLNRMAVGQYVVDEGRVAGRGPIVERIAVLSRVRDGLVDRESILR